MWRVKEEEVISLWRVRGKWSSLQLVLCKDLYFWSLEGLIPAWTSLLLVLCQRLLAPGFCPSSLPYLPCLLHPSLQIQKNRSKKGAASVGDSVSVSSSHACQISCQCCWALFSLNMMRQVRRLDCSPVSAVFRIMIFLFSIILFSPTPCDLRSVQAWAKVTDGKFSPSYSQFLGFFCCFSFGLLGIRFGNFPT